MGLASQSTSQSSLDCGLESWNLLKNLAPQVGLEPTTLRLTAECSTIELLRSALKDRLSY